MLSEQNARLAAARRLTSRKGRRGAGRFLVEGAQAVREALLVPDAVIEVFTTETAQRRNPDLIGTAQAAGIPVSVVSDTAAAALSETTTPQGLVATAHPVDVPLTELLAAGPPLLAGLVDANEPGNAGAIIRTADAAGAGGVVLAGDSVDPYNGKAVRASAGSLFHLPVVVGHPPLDLVRAAVGAGYQVLATTGSAEREVADLDLAAPTLWLFGNEANGLPRDVLAAATCVRIPIYGRAESLNLAAAAAVCLYASTTAQH